MTCPKCGRRNPLIWVIVAALLAVLLLASAVYAADPPPLGLEETARLALERQPRLEAQAAAIQALRDDAVAARQLPDPRLILGVEGVPVDSFSLTRQEMTQTVVGISQMIPGGDKQRLAGLRLEHEAGRGESLLRAGRRETARDAGLAWLEAYLPETALTLVTEIEAAYARQVEWSQVAYKTGQMAQDEALALRAMLASTLNRKADLEGQSRRARAGLARWIGEAASRPLAPLAEPPPPQPEDLQAGLDGHPELQALRAGIEAARTGADLARQAYRPDWSVDFAYGIRGDDRADTLKLMVGVDLPLFAEKRQDRRLAARQAEVNQMERMLEDRRRMLAAELAAAQADWRAADDRLARIDRDILPLLGQRLDSALAAYRTGKAGYDRVLDARRAELEARLERLGLAVARARAAISLAYYNE